MKINGKLWHICYTNRSKYISEYTVLATIKLYSYIYIYMITISIFALCEQSAFKPVCIRRCPCFHYCKLNHSDIVERYKVIFIDDVFFFYSFIFELLTLLLEYAFLYHVYTSHMQWWSIEYNVGFLWTKLYASLKALLLQI